MAKKAFNQAARCDIILDELVVCCVKIIVNKFNCADISVLYGETLRKISNGYISLKYISYCEFLSINIYISFPVTKNISLSSVDTSGAKRHFDVRMYHEDRF